MAIVLFEHYAYDKPARVGDILRDVGHQLRVIKLHEGEPVPVDLDDIDGIVSLGGPMNVTERNEHAWMEPEMALLKAAHDADVPIVGVCLGMQMLAEALGGEVGPMEKPEYGFEQVQLGFPGTIDPIYAGVPWKSWQFHSHRQEVKKLPDGATPLAGSKACRTQAFKVGLRTYGFQYHFEWTKPDLKAVLDRVEQAGRAGDIDLGATRSQIDEHYDLYRHLSDRLISNLATLLFAIDKRLGHRATIEAVANFKPAKS